MAGQHISFGETIIAISIYIIIDWLMYNQYVLYERAFLTGVGSYCILYVLHPGSQVISFSIEAKPCRDENFTFFVPVDSVTVLLPESLVCPHCGSPNWLIINPYACPFTVIS